MRLCEPTLLDENQRKTTLMSITQAGSAHQPLRFGRPDWEVSLALNRAYIRAFFTQRCDLAILNICNGYGR